MFLFYSNSITNDIITTPAKYVVSWVVWCEPLEDYFIKNTSRQYDHYKRDINIKNISGTDLVVT